MIPGYSFYADIRKTWNIQKIKIDRYIYHLKNGTFKSQNLIEWLKLYERT